MFNTQYLDLENKNSNYNLQINNDTNTLNNNFQNHIFSNDFIIEKPDKIPNFSIENNYILNKNNDKSKTLIENKSHKKSFNLNNKKIDTNLSRNNPTLEFSKEAIDPLCINSDNKLNLDEMIINYSSLKNIYNPKKGGDRNTYIRICNALVNLNKLLNKP